MKMMKKLGALVLALCMCTALCVTAFADDEQFTITVSNAGSGETYTAYKIFDVTYSGDSYSYTIDESSAWYSTVAAATDVFTLTKVGESTTYNVTVKSDATDEAIIAVFTGAGVPDGAAAAATVTVGKLDANGNEADEEYSGPTGTTTVMLDVTTSGAGYYFVTTSLGSVVSINTAAPAVTIAEKNPAPTLTKEVENVSHGGELQDNGDETEGDEDTAKVGDVLEFEITISSAAHKSALCLHDYTTEGLTYNGSGSIHVYLNEVSRSTEVSNNNYWIITEGVSCEDGCDFEIEFDAKWLDELDDEDVIIVTYEAVVNEEAVQINKNDAFLTYGVGGHSVVVETETDVFGFDLEKVDGNNNELDGATFTLAYGDSFGTTLSGTLVEFYFDGATYTVHDATDEKYATEQTTTDILVGSASIFGLDAGTYTLTETEAPDGYNKLTSSITVTISAEGDVTISTLDGVSMTDGTITVVNNAGSELPSTGGIGTTIFYIAGAVLICGAAVVLVTRRRMVH